VAPQRLFADVFASAINHGGEVDTNQTNDY
jgi:hypothetical protein